MEKENNCVSTDQTNRTVFACSGAADLGQVSDLVARELSKNKISQMKCLAFVSAGITEMIDSVRDTNMLVIDGCPLDCGKKTFEKNGLTNFKHLRLTDLGYEKGKTPPTTDVISQIYQKAVLVH